jgi:RloB-like protein
MSRNKFSRKRKFKEVGTKVVIICEGETEKIYFEAIRKSRRLSTVKIEVVNPDYTDPEHIVKTAIARRNELLREKRWFAKDEMWAVYDGDEHKDANINNWNNAIQLANQGNIRLGISNPSFELWYLLHYQDQNAAIHRDETTRRLKLHLPDYHKTADLYESYFKPRTNFASTRAQNLSEIIVRDSLESYSNPSTEIYLLVRRLLKL